MNQLLSYDAQLEQFWWLPKIVMKHLSCQLLALQNAKENSWRTDACALNYRLDFIEVKFYQQNIIFIKKCAPEFRLSFKKKFYLGYAGIKIRDQLETGRKIQDRKLQL